MLHLLAYARQAWEQISHAIGTAALFSAGLFISGCTTFGNDFIVDVELPDPLIYSPGSAPNQPLWIPLDGFALSCDETTVTVRHRPDATVSFRLANKAGTGKAPFTKIVVAELEPDVVKNLADAALMGSFDNLATSFEEVTRNKGCILTFGDRPESSVAAMAANTVENKLPRKYSAMLRSAYNHRVWPQNKAADTLGVTVDLFAGMRLRIENSVPISPQGAGSMDAHPSSFAAPTYLYFHSLTGAELCDPRAKPQIDNSNRCKEVDEENWDQTTFLSPNGGVARLGLVQKSGTGNIAASNRKLPPKMLSTGPVTPSNFTATYLANFSLARTVSSDLTLLKPQEVLTTGVITFTQQISSPKKIIDTNDVAVPVSSLIDLLEWTSVGKGAQRYWRLWLPGYRSTTASTPVGSENGGSTEAIDSTPLLFSADKLEELPSNKAFGSSQPCSISANITVKWTCYRLHYRVVPVPEIAIWVNGTREWVAIGTTLRDVAADRIHGGFNGRPNHFSANASLGTLADEAPAITATRLARNVATSLRLTRLYGDGPHAVNAHSLANATDVARFLRLQLMPGDEIKWTK